ncbi:Esterase B1 [Frankliniella fusca]|uniref:Carboxylic ester hydrolase n=1 Tax=Frankliniella fusca TaxID=407009 RepID=A0AAE1HBT5_9NEOP|nr:Esterase B1 [Frankliniella fusca]
MAKSVVVKTDKGPIRGKEVVSEDTGEKYFSFQGIPYARPPVGSLRFKPPEDIDPWTEVKDCRQEAKACIQRHMYLRDLRGSEDCLYLNVYSPQLNIWGASKLPVMVRIHGGGFTTGSAGVEMNGPDFIVQERVILVTVGYRLRFLCVDEPGDAQGNMGLKDQVAALKWVKKNISSFGGDPKRVTISGESAGGASVHLHMMSPMSQGLFSSAIAESGVAINPWAFTSEGRTRAFRLGESLGCKAQSSKELIQFLQSVPAEDLVNAANKAFSNEDKEYYCVVSPFPFVPTVEVSDGSVEPFLSVHPIKLLNEGKFFKGPFMAGVNNREGMLLLAAIFGKDRKEMLKKFDGRIPKLVPTDLSMQRGSSRENDIASSMRLFYMKNKPLTGDLMFIYGFYKAMKCHSKHTSVYVYEFSYEGAFNVFKNVVGEDNMPGACHSDELGYLFKMDLLPSAPSDSHAYVMRNVMVKLWTNFVKTGNPTFRKSNPINVNWFPCNSSQSTYLELGKTIQNKKGVIAEKRMQYWDDLYKDTSKLKNKL